MYVGELMVEHYKNDCKISDSKVQAEIKQPP